MREHGLGPFGRADPHPRRNPLDRQGRFAAQPGSAGQLAGVAAPLSGQLGLLPAPLSRCFSRIVWPLGRCRPPMVLAMGQNRQKTGKTCLLSPSTSSGRMGPQ
jgi:hypothetical protein